MLAAEKIAGKVSNIAVQAKPPSVPEALIPHVQTAISISLHPERTTEVQAVDFETCMAQEPEPESSCETLEKEKILAGMCPLLCRLHGQ